MSVELVDLEEESEPTIQCPVCRANNALPVSGGYRCLNCGTEAKHF